MFPGHQHCYVMTTSTKADRSYLMHRSVFSPKHLVPSLTMFILSQITVRAMAGTCLTDSSSDYLIGQSQAPHTSMWLALDACIPVTFFIYRPAEKVAILPLSRKFREAIVNSSLRHSSLLSLTTRHWNLYLYITRTSLPTRAWDSFPPIEPFI